MKHYRIFVRLTLGLSLVCQTTPLWAAEEQTTLQVASGEELATAVAHYARSRSLLIAAIREFDAGRKSADPGALIDSQAWRDILLARAQDLEKVLDPQPRASKTGITTNPDPRLLGLDEK